MKNITFAIVLLSTALSLCVVGLLELKIAYASPYTDIDVATAYNMITNGSYPNLVVLDVRTKSEYDGGHIYGAVWIPHTELEARIDELAGHENHEMIVYCGSGVRSATASGILDSHNFTKVYNMLNGISAWQSADYPVWNATVHNVNTTFNYDTIQAAIDAPQTSYGHTILVDAGTYYEHLVVDKSISLVGENRSTTVIDGNGTGNVIVIDITANHVNVTGFTIRNGTNGIFINWSDYNIISGNIVTDNLHGFHLFSTCSCNYVSKNTIRNNIIKNNGFGVSLGVSSDNTIYHNNFINNTEQANYVYGSYSNVWDDDYPSGGNYWSDYEERYPDAEELDGSGIWNTTYVIDENNRDRYPLMSPWGDVEPPVADAGPDQSVFQGMTVTFDASGSTDDVATKSYVWTFTDVTLKTLTGIQPQYTFNNASDFEVTLNVTDYAGKWDTDTVWIHVLPDTTKPSIGVVSQEPEVPDDGEKVTITVNVTDGESGVHNVTLSYSTNEGDTWTDVPVNKTTGDNYVGEIPGLPAGTNVQYKITAYDKAGNFKVDDKAGEYYVYTVIPEFPTWTSMLLILIVLTVAIAIYKRRLLKTPIH